MPPPNGAPRQVLYNLFWCKHPREQAGAVSTGGVCEKLVRPPAHEAIILYPAFLTPAVCSVAPAPEPGQPPAAGEDVFEMLVLAPAEPELTAELVNRHLKISTGLDWEKWATTNPLFAQPTSDLLEVQKVSSFERDAILKTDLLSTPGGPRFRGVVDPRFWESKDAWEKGRADKATKEGTKAPAPLDTLYQVRVDVSCVASAGPPRAEIARIVKPAQKLGRSVMSRLSYWRNVEPDDELIDTVIERHHGEGLKPGRAFQVNPGPGVGNVDLGATRGTIRSFHPVYVFEGLGFARLGHVADLHLNSRQQFLAKTTARVVEGEDGVGSPRIGQFVNVYADNVLAVLKRLAEHGSATENASVQDPIDVLLVGGDLVDHVKNVYPYGKRDRAVLDKPALSPAEVWDIVGLDAKDPTYQKFVDHTTVYSVMRYFCDTFQKPAFVVSGNHDGYLEPYGISPRLLGKRNEGIPGDHNLTFYEAILAFGESYDDVPTTSAINLHTDLFEWFYTVFTPFADYAVDLPKQRIVGLAWGDNEAKVWASNTDDEHGVGHLPRANEAVTDRQVELFEEALADRAKRVVLSTHFTFVSYINKLANLPAPVEGVVRASRMPEALTNPTFSMCDWGTFELHRDKLYSKLHASAQGGPGGDGPLIHCVFTGHSHRKGLYYVSGKKDPRTIVTFGTPFTRRYVAYNNFPLLGVPVPKIVSEQQYTTQMFPLRDLGAGWVTAQGQRVTLPQVLQGYRDATPIIASDSAGPVPRMNVQGEFDEWGSDWPAGTFVGFSDKGVVDRIEPVCSEDQSRSKPRAVVAIDYLHVVQDRGIVSILTDAWRHDNPGAKVPHTIEITFHPRFPNARVRIDSAVLHCKQLTTGGWTRIALKRPSSIARNGQLVVALSADPEDAGALYEVLTASGTMQLLSLKLAAADDLVGAVYEFTRGGTWDFEVSAMPDYWGGRPEAFRLVHKMEPPDFKMRAEYFPARYTKK